MHGCATSYCTGLLRRGFLDLLLARSAGLLHRSLDRGFGRSRFHSRLGLAATLLCGGRCRSLGRRLGRSLIGRFRRSFFLHLLGPGLAGRLFGRLGFSLVPRLVLAGNQAARNMAAQRGLMSDADLAAPDAVPDMGLPYK